MNFEEILVAKSNIFNHILYEFEMYMYTYTSLMNLPSKGSNIQFDRNILIESHAVHLRNLIEFFNCEKNCISTSTIFDGTHDLSFDDSTIKAKQTINKAIDHLTKERYMWNQSEKDLTIRFNKVIHVMYNQYIVFKIKDCVGLLLDGTDIKPEFSKELADSAIQSKLSSLSSKLANI